MGVLHPSELTAPRGGIVRHQAAKSDLQVLVYPLCLAIRLGMEA